MSGQGNYLKVLGNGRPASLYMHQRWTLMQGIRDHCVRAGLIYFKVTGTLQKSCAVSHCNRGATREYVTSALSGKLIGVCSKHSARDASGAYFITMLCADMTMEYGTDVELMNLYDLASGADPTL